MSRNPLIEAPHVPKRAPEWGQFIDSSSHVRAGAKPAARSTLWSQAPSNPYSSDSTASDGGLRGRQQQGSLRPAWLQQAGAQPQQHLPEDGGPMHHNQQSTPGQIGQRQWPSQQQLQQQLKQQGQYASLQHQQQLQGGVASAVQQPRQQADRQQPLQQHQRQQQSVASSCMRLHQQQGGNRSRTSTPRPAWQFDGEDDVMLPDSLWGWDQECTASMKAPAAAAVAACATVPVSGAHVAPAATHWQGGSGNRPSTGLQQQQSMIARQAPLTGLQQPQHQQQHTGRQPWGVSGSLTGSGSCQQLQQHQPAAPSAGQQQSQHHTLHMAHSLGVHAAGTHQQAAPFDMQQDKQQQQQCQQQQLPQRQHMEAAPPVPPKQQQQQHKQSAAASLWSGGVDVASLRTGTGQRQQRQVQGRTAAAGSGDAAAAAAGSGDAAAAAAGNKQTSSKAKGGQRSIAKGASSSSEAVMEFVPRQPGDAAAQQPKLHQTTLFDTLKRAQRNKQQEQHAASIEQDGAQQDGKLGKDLQQAQEGSAPSKAAAAKQPAVRKRKHSAVAAASAAEASGGNSGVASGGRRAGRVTGSRGSSRAAKTARLSKAAAALEGAVEVLDTWSLSNSNNATAQQAQQPQQQQGAVMRDATVAGSVAWQQLQQELAAAEGVALGLLYSKVVVAPAAADPTPLAVQYFTSMQQPYKQQQLMLTKTAAAARKQAASSAAAATDSSGTAAEAGGEAGQEAPEAAGTQQLVGVVLQPVARPSAAPAAARASYLIHLWERQQAGRQQAAPMLPPHVLQLLQAVLCDSALRPCICCGAKAVLCALMEQGLQLPCASAVSLIDPELLGWLLDPQLIQDTKQEACYTLQQQLSRSGLQPQVPDVEALRPLQRLHHQLQQSLQLATHLHTQLGSGGVAGQAIKLEMQVAALMAKMERAGVACMPAVLSDHRATLAARLAAIKARAAQLVGYEFNLSSSSQLAKVLYEDLRLTPPAGGGGRGAAKTHLSTNEAALKQLAVSHELPGLVLEHRCIVNVMSKWIDAQWVRQAAQAPGGRVHCIWQQTSTATGRLSSCGPNMQAVTKYTVTAQDAAAGGGCGVEQDSAASLLNINVRDAFVAPPGKLLLSADYSQIELRLLAHFSEDKLLCQILSQSTGDVFNMIAAALQHAGARQDAWLTAPNTVQALPEVSPEERERAKRVVYGIVYGLTPYGLAQQLVEQGVTTTAAQSMIDSFLARFPGVRQFMARSISAAQASGAVSTLMGRRRPIPGLRGDFQERAAAERKVVNTQVQGSAADLIKLAMCAWEQWVTQQQPAGPRPQASGSGSSSSNSPVQAQLIAQIHDELLFEVAAPDALSFFGPDGAVQHPGQQFIQVAAAVARLMEGASPMTVPLRVKLAWGHSWGALNILEL